MGKIFKKAKKAVKRVFKGVTKAAKKIGKGIAKVGRNIWDGVKQIGGKAFELYGKLSSKLGPIGMIGLSVAMPFLMPGFSSAAGGLWTNFGAKMGVKATVGQAGFGWANHATNPFLRTIGQIGGKIYRGANFVKGTMQGISQTISETFSGFAGEGTIGSRVSKGFNNLYRGTAEVLTGQSGRGTMWSQSASSVLGTSGKIGESVMMPMINPETITQTGGIALGNMNVANKFVYQAQAKAMQFSGAFKGWKGDSSKYLNTLREAGLDDRTAFDYLRNNGIDGTGVLDKSLSADFKWTGSPTNGSYEFTGNNLRNTFNKANHNFNMRITKPTVDGDVFMQNDSLLNSKSGYSKTKNTKDALLDYAMKNQDNDVAGYDLAMVGIKAQDVNSTTGKWEGTHGTYIKSGQLITDAHRKFFANQNLDLV